MSFPDEITNENRLLELKLGNMKGARRTMDLTKHPIVIKSEDIKRKDFFGIGYEIFWSMKKFKNNIAQYIWENDREETYELLLQKSIRTALRLKSKKLDEDPIIAICAVNHSNANIPVISALFLGWRLVTFDASQSVNDMSYLLKQVTPNIMFIDEEAVPMMEAAMEKSGHNFELIVFGKSDIHSVFDEYLEVVDEKEEERFEPVKLDSNQRTAIILFSSGTTGMPKGICLPHGGLLYQAYNLCHVQSCSSTSVFLYFSPLHWIAASCFFLTSTLSGASRVICPVSQTWKAVHKYQVTIIYVSPFLASLIVGQNKGDELKTNSVKSLFTAGTRLNSTLREKLVKLFPTTLITQSYGQTELCGWGTMFENGNEEDFLLAQRKHDSCGKPMPGLSYKIVEQNSGKTLGPNNIGELRIKSNFNFMNGYFKKDASEAFDSEGWLRTGDLFYYDEDKCFYMVGRCKEMLKYRGFHIQPEMLERILESHPAVDKSVVIGITHEVDGDHLMGLVVLKAEYGVISPKDIELFVEKQVQERQRLRAGVKIITAIPLTSTGKPKRNAIKEMVETGSYM